MRASGDIGSLFGWEGEEHVRFPWSTINNGHSPVFIYRVKIPVVATAAEAHANGCAYRQQRLGLCSGHADCDFPCDGNPRWFHRWSHAPAQKQWEEQRLKSSSGRFHTCESVSLIGFVNAPRDVFVTVPPPPRPSPAGRGSNAVRLGLKPAHAEPRRGSEAVPSPSGRGQGEGERPRRIMSQRIHQCARWGGVSSPRRRPPARHRRSRRAEDSAPYPFPASRVDYEPLGLLERRLRRLESIRERGAQFHLVPPVPSHSLRK